MLAINQKPPDAPCITQKGAMPCVTLKVLKVNSFLEHGVERAWRPLGYSEPFP